MKAEQHGSQYTLWALFYLSAIYFLKRRRVQAVSSGLLIMKHYLIECRLNNQHAIYKDACGGKLLFPTFDPKSSYLILDCGAGTGL